MIGNTGHRSVANCSDMTTSHSSCSHEEGPLVDLLDTCVAYITDKVGQSRRCAIMKRQKNVPTFFAVGHEVEVGHTPINRPLGRNAVS